MPLSSTARVNHSITTTTTNNKEKVGTSASAKRKKRKSREGSQSTKKPSSTASSATASAVVGGGEKSGSRRVSSSAVVKSKRSSSGGSSRSRRSSSRSRRSHRSSSERRSQIQYEEGRRQYEEEGENQNPDCCNDCITIAVKSIHIIDIAAGLTLLIYGFVVSGQPNAPSEAVAILISYGFVYVMTSALGIIGFNSNWCHRFGLVVSAYGGPLIGCMEFISIICIAALKDDFFEYLQDNRKALLMNEKTVNNLEKSFGVFVCIALFCAVIEVCRFFMLRPLQESLLQSDDVETKKQQRSPIMSRDSTEELNQLLTELAEPLLSHQQQVPSSEKTSSNRTGGSGNKGKQGGRRHSPNDFTTSSKKIGKTGSVRSMSLQPERTNPPTFGLTSTAAAVAATAAAARATSLPPPSSSGGGRRGGGNWFTRSLGLGGGNNSAEAIIENVQGEDNDNDEEEYRTRASSPDEFAPVDETISTEDLWWSHAERDEKMDMSWLEDTDDIHNNEEHRRRRGGGGGRRPR